MFFINFFKVFLVFYLGFIEKVEIYEKVVERRENIVEVLLEGFFDDFEVDVKVWKVDVLKD